jgi:hypothetical protein
MSWEGLALVVTFYVRGTTELRPLLQTGRWFGSPSENQSRSLAP